MNRSAILPAVVAILVLAAIAISRLPFLDAGYGMNHDAWRVARAARLIAATGRYEASRFPGYPVHEITCAFFRWGGPVALNALSAAFSVAAAVAVWRIALRLGSRDATLLAVAFAATPVVYINSVSSKDYVWAIAFVLWAMYAAMTRRPAIAGVLFGLAIGCRITSGAMLLPLALIIFGEQREWKALARFGVCAGVMALAAFAPVFARYGWDLLTFYHTHDRPAMPTILRRGTLEVWGAVGVVGLLAAVVSVFAAKWRGFTTSIAAPFDRLFTAAITAWLILYIVAFLALPDQAGYLIPLVPVVLLILARTTARPVLQVACVCLVAAPFMDVSGGKIVTGPVVADGRERLAAVRDVQRFIALTEEKLPAGTLVVIGAWEPLVLELFHETPLRNTYAYLLNAAELQEAAKSGRRLAYATEAIRAFNHRVHGIDLAAHGAVDVRRIVFGAPPP